MASAESECISKEVRAGKPQDQAVAICLNKQRESLLRFSREAQLTQVNLLSYSIRNKFAQKKSLTGY